MSDKSAKIVVVDDNPGTQYATARVLESAGFQVFRAGTGQAALELAAHDPDLYLLDVNLPDMHGFEVCRRLRSLPQMARTPIIHISASFMTGADQVSGLDTGADGYLLHPVEPPVLIATVRAFLRARVAEQQLRESEARFRKMADAAPAMLWITDANNQCTFLSGAWLEFTGQTEADGLGVGWIETIHPDDRSAVIKAFHAAAQRRQFFTVDCRFRRADGMFRWCVDTGRPVRGPSGNFEGYVGCVIDIHDRKSVEAALTESEEKFRTLADNISQLAWMADASGEISWFNRRWGEFTGLPMTGMTERDWRTIHHPDHMDRVNEKLRRHLKSGEAWEDVFPLRSKEGEYRWFLARAVPIRDESGRIVRWFGTNTDITDQKRGEEERAALLDSERAARAELDRAGRIKDEFLGTLSHELRTPLNAIIGWTFLLKRDASPETVAQGVEVIDRNARIQSQLIADLLDISRVISGKLRLDVQPVVLPRVIDAALDSVRLAAEAKGIRIESIIEPMHEPVRGDPSRLQQVFWNLLSNAIKFTNKDGRIQISLARVNSQVEMTVSDTGRGIRPELLDCIFDRFRQADASAAREHGGLGIGLALVKQIVELHGGKIHASSEGEGKGATFVVVLPVAAIYESEDSFERAHPRSIPLTTPVVGEPPKLDGMKILLVDDEPDALDTISRLLLECNANVTAVESAQEGLAALKRQQFDLIISDIGMPIFDGYEFMRRVREQFHTAPALALTAFARSEDRTRALQAGFQAHVSKPVEPWELLAAVAALGRPRGESNAGRAPDRATQS